MIKIKRVIAITFALTLLTLLAFNTSAQAYGEGVDLIPYLNYTLSADGYVIHSPAIKGVDGQSFTNLVGDPDDLTDVSFIAQDVITAVYDDFTQAEAKIYYDFVDSTVNGQSFRPTTFAVNYSPFTIKYGDAFQYSNVQTGTTTARLDSYTLYEAIGGVFEWYGAAEAYVEGEVTFRLNYVKRGLADTAHNVYEYHPLTCLYSVSFGNVFTNGFYASTLSLADMSFYNVTDDVSMTFNDFHNDIVSKTGVLRTANQQNNIDLIYLDVERCDIRINVVNAPFAGLVQPYAQYVDVAGYDYFNGLYWNIYEGAYAHRQQHRGSYVALMTADVLNRKELHHIAFDDNVSPIVRVPALFLSAVADFFAIDFFGMGFTLGHLTFVIALAAVVLIFLKVFAGG